MANKDFADQGVIKKIYLKDFVTYNEVVFTPGRYLNTVIGPNGTGKSTLVAAIALGLGGTPKILGKPGDIGQYVRAGCEKALIEIDLIDKPNRSIKISRMFTKKNKSVWMINREIVTEAKITEKITSFNIQVNNLCQFLPQEKVKDFSKMNGKELLINTEKSVGNPKLYEHHMKLIENRTEQERITNEIGQKKTVLESMVQKHQQLEESVSTIKERKAIKKKIASLNQKKAWVVYDIARKSVTELKDKSDGLKNQVNNLKSILSPILDQINEKEHKIKELETAVKSYHTQVKTCESKLLKNIENIESLHINITNIKKSCNEDIKLEENRDKLIKLEEVKKNKLENDMQLMTEEIGTEETVNQKLQVVNRNINNQREIIDDVNSKIVFYKEKLDLVTRKIIQLERELQQLKDIESKRMEKLHTMSSDTYKGVLWLRENKDKFRGVIHEPMFLSIEIKELKYSKFFEKILATRDLLAFVCEDKQDMSLLLRCLRDQQNLVVNVIYSDPRQPLNIEPNIPLQNIKRYGFYSYSTAFIDAPPTIMKYLTNMYSIHNIPFGSATVEDYIDHIPKEFFSYFSPSNHFSVRVSRYSGDKSTQITRLPNTGRIFSIMMEYDKINNINTLLQQKVNERAEFEAKLKEIETKYREYSLKMDSFRNTKKELERHIGQIRTLKAHINRATDELSLYLNQRKSVEDIKNVAKERIINALKKQTEMYKECAIQHKKVVSIVTQSKSKNLQLKLTEQELKIIINDSRNFKDKLEEVKKKYKDLEKQITPMKNEAQKLYNEASRLTDGKTPDDRAGFARFAKAFFKLPLQVKEIEDAIQSAKARLYCMSDNTDGEQILEEYERTKQSVDTLKEELAKLDDKLVVIQKETDELCDEWLPLVNDLLENINTKFTEYFTSLGCVGEIALHHGENPMDFDQYEFKISVKFRDTDNLQEFTRQRQSGGERAVTTAIYMLSLQELCRVPFRCVDEINQGMDAVYERRIFDLLVELTSKPKGSQYFLITPKLLPNLNYSEYVRVHVVHNGPYVIPQNRFNLQDYCARLGRNIN